MITKRRDESSHFKKSLIYINQKIINRRTFEDKEKVEIRE